jgi:hypothetical protein
MSQENSSNSTQKPYPEADASQQSGKVAEGVAAYSYTTVEKPAAPPHQIAGIAASEDVWCFVLKNQLAAHLETAVSLVRMLFPQAVDVQFAYEIDPEIANATYVTISAKVRGEFDTLVRADWKFTEELLRTVPKDKASYIHFSPIVI